MTKQEVAGAAESLSTIKINSSRVTTRHMEATLQLHLVAQALSLK